LGTTPILIPDQEQASEEPVVKSSFSINTPAKAAQSIAVRAMTPIPSKLSLNVKTPSTGTEPGRNLSPYRPLQLAGKTTEPAVSVPMAMGQKPAATLTAEPEEEPPGVLENVSRLGFSRVAFRRRKFFTYRLVVIR
jgi:hypothetical protein